MRHGAIAGGVDASEAELELGSDDLFDFLVEVSYSVCNLP